jgi:steroid delta-isomerase
MQIAADAKIRAVQTYVAGYAAGDVDTILSIFAEDAYLEDPVGTPVHKGKAALRAFFSVGIEMKAKLHMLGDVRCAGDSAAFAFAVELEFDGVNKWIEVIDVFRFDDVGKVTEMRAYWGPENMKDV